MSPEQAKGKSVDKRADIWAFGVLLYEMVTGQQPFTCETVADTLVAVLTKEPDWKKVSGRTLSLLRRCLEKDPRGRLRDIGEAMAWIERAPGLQRSKRTWQTWSAAAALLLILGVLYLLYRHSRMNTPAPEAMQLQFAPTVAPAPEGSFALSPDGRWLAFVARGVDGLERVWIRALDSLQARPLLGTESDYIPPLFWSPDSRFVVFSSGGRLKKSM